MASYTWAKAGTPGTDSGVWNDTANWNPATGYPSVTGDTYTVPGSLADCIMNINLDPATVALGAGSITGILRHAVDANTCLPHGDVNQTINSGGYYKIGASGAIIPKAYVAQNLFTPGSDNSKGMVISSGGQFCAYGDPDYYGGDGTQAYMRAVTVSCATTSLVVEGDYSGWNCNDSLVIYRNAAYSSWLTDVVPVQIHASTAPSYNAGTDQTTITLTAATSVTGTFNAGGYVWNLTRNVKIGKYISDAEPWPLNVAGTSLKQFTYRPNITNNNTSTSNVTLSSCCFQGLYRFTCSNLGISATDLVLRHCYQALYIHYLTNITSGIICTSANVCQYMRKSTIGSDFLGCYGLSTTSKATINGGLYSCYSISFTHNDTVYNGDIVNLALGFSSTGGNITVYGNCYNNNRINDAGGNNIKFMGIDLGYDIKDVERNNTYNFLYAYGSDILYDNCKIATETFYNRNTAVSMGRIKFSAYDQTADDDRVYDCFGTIYRKDADTGTEPDSRTTANDQVLKIQTETYCSAINPLLIINPDKHRVYCAAGVTKRWRYYCQTDSATELVDGDRANGVDGITMEASYLDGTTNSSRTTVISTQHIQPRTGQDDWYYLEVECTPAVDGYIYLSVYIMMDVGYAAGDWLWVDPLVEEIAAVPLKYAVIWSEGESQLAQMDQTEAWLIRDAVWEALTTSVWPTDSFGEKVDKLWVGSP